MNYPLSGGSSRPRSGHILVCLACLGLIIAARAKQQQPAFGLPVRPTNPPLRCRDVRWCVQLGLCCSPAQGCSGGRMGQLQSLSSPLAPRGWQPLAMTTRLTCVHTEQSSHRLSHEACSVDRPSHRRFVNGSSQGIAYAAARACTLVVPCVQTADTRMRA